MKLKKLLLILMIVVFLRILYLAFYPNIMLTNNETLYNQKYNPNIKVYNLFSNLSKYMMVKNEVDEKVIGTYNISVNIKYFIYRVSKVYSVKVVDKVKPSIILNGSNIGLACPNKDYVEEGYTANDDYDGDITDKVTSVVGDVSIKYSVSDSSGNTFSTERTIEHTDKEAPSISLNGDSTIYLYVGDNYQEPGYSASDNCDGDITDKVVSTGSVDTSKTGTYTVTYTLTDSSNNTTTVERTIVVRKIVTQISYGNGIIYLTFDDGPSERTREILDILDEEGVKATFFVCGANAYTVRAYNSGHTIALHSNTHNYSYIYASSDNFFSDLNAIDNTVYNSIGIHPKIIRFPGGSSNTISRHYHTGIMSYLTSEVVNRGYSYYDWNVDSNDAGSDVYNSNNIYYNVINHLSHNKTNVVLMHDSGGHSATVKALRNIIRTAKEYGYTFRAIDSSTPAVHHGVNN